MTQDPRLTTHFEQLQQQHKDLNAGYAEINAAHAAFKSSREELRQSILMVIAELGRFLLSVVRMKVSTK